MHGSCHCGAVGIEVARPPEWVAECNCSLCTRLGTLMSYYRPSEVSVTGWTVPYVWGDRMIAIHHCPVCACTTHWSAFDPGYDRMGVNARLLDGFAELEVERRPIDGASF